MPYKVVRRTPEGYVSAVVNIHGMQEEFIVTYYKNGWARPSIQARNAGYGLLYFQYLEDAVDFRNGCLESQDMEIWQCEVRGEMDLPPRGWKNLLYAIATGDHDWFRTIAWPTGTHMAREIKLVRRMEHV